jgi:hypothetical protein
VGGGGGVSPLTNQSKKVSRSISQSAPHTHVAVPSLAPDKSTHTHTQSLHRTQHTHKAHLVELLDPAQEVLVAGRHEALVLPLVVPRVRRVVPDLHVCVCGVWF